MQRISTRVCCGIFAVLCLSSTSAKALPDCGQDGFKVGAAQADITGPIAELGMMGYADLAQVDNGLHMRLRSRAMVLSDLCDSEPFAMVIMDLAMVFHNIKQGVIDGLAQELPGVFNHTNVLLSATHTHAGPGGYAHNVLYNVTTKGFSGENYRAIVDGTVRSIVKAYRQRQRSRLTINQGDLQGIQFNRSLSSYEANPKQEQDFFGQNTDPAMLQIRADSDAGQPLASFNWFAVHGVSLPMENRLVSGDNKGLAAYLFEQKLGSRYDHEQEFVAGFVQSNSGDVSPYDISTPVPKGIDGFARNESSAKAQFEKAYELFKDAEEELTGPLSSVHSFVDMAYYPIDEQFTGQGPQTTCQAALGVGFAAGTENGNPAGLFKEGTVWGQNWPKITLMPEEQRCQAEKVILLPTGFARPHPWTAQIVPVQLLRIGQLVVIAAPFEITTMAGRRLRKAILEKMAPAGVRYVAISALANEYVHYVTTREEYAQQNYEGGATLFGPWSLAAFTQIYSRLADQLLSGQTPDPGPLPKDLSAYQWVRRPPVLFDSVPRGESFGAIRAHGAEQYRPGERVEIQFWGAHPNNSLEGRNTSLLTVEQKIGDDWLAIRQDWDPDTTYTWRREGLSQSLVTISWQTKADLPWGVYRICHQGQSKALLGGKLSPYRGCSMEFLLNGAIL